MSTDNRFAGGIPALYDELLVPLIFAPYARDLGVRVAAVSSGAVLETAAGTGVVTRAAEPLLGPGCRYVATDLNEPMLALAAERQGAGSRVDWRTADALALPFEDGRFDVVVCQFGVMFFPDRVAGFAEARRVLRKGGRLLFNVWDRIETNGFAEVVTNAAGEVFPDDPPRFLARTPHGYHDVSHIRADLEKARFATVAVETLTFASRAASPRDPAAAYCQGTPLRNEIVARDPGALEAVTARATAAIEKEYGAGPVEAPIQAHVVTATVAS